MKGKFLVIEGGEGAGKTSTIAAVAQELKNASYDIMVTREPGGTRFGEALRSIILTKETTSSDPMAQLLVFLAARRQHVEMVIKPALQRGITVICDRYDASSWAYQVTAIYGESSPKLFQEWMGFARMAGYLPPDAYIMLDVDPIVGLERAASRKDVATYFDDKALEFHQRVRAAMKDYMKFQLNGNSIDPAIAGATTVVFDTTNASPEATVAFVAAFLEEAIKG